MSDPCPDCRVAPGDRHQRGCDVARCKECGQQAIACEDHNSEQTSWTGEWPGVQECRELGWWVRWGPPWTRTTADDPDAWPDLNRLAMGRMQGLRWDSDRERWVLCPPPRWLTTSGGCGSCAQSGRG